MGESAYILDRKRDIRDYDERELFADGTQ